MSVRIPYVGRHTDMDVIRGILDGDIAENRAIEELYRLHRKPLIGRLRRLGASEAEAVDIMQNAIILFWEKVKSGRLELKGSIGAYLASVSYFLWMDVLKRKALDRKCFESLALEKEAMKSGFEHPEISHSQQKLLLGLMDQISETCRELLERYYLKNESLDAIATAMGYKNEQVVRVKKRQMEKRMKVFIEAKPRLMAMLF